MSKRASPENKSRNTVKVGIFGVSVASAIALSGFYGIQDKLRSDASDSEAGSRTPGYLFGFAHAALAVCNALPGPGLDRLGEAVERDSHGKLPEDVKIGFAEFSQLQLKIGITAACRQAESLLGPHSPQRPNVLLPR